MSRTIASCLLTLLEQRRKSKQYLTQLAQRIAIAGIAIAGAGNRSDRKLLWGQSRARIAKIGSAIQRALQARHSLS
jgi:hypothetical protein